MRPPAARASSSGRTSRLPRGAPETLLLCPSCKVYTMAERCPRCSTPSVKPGPARYSPEDNYGEYRRKLKLLTRNKPTAEVR
ncbi:MAG TPA: RNA-protein complex protein Nop10 [Candidatus Thermoplasmatota archaeon]|nr:RNA-protein complex protein Nop10 [Candidatus Thermoplasmatota archaeon]